MKNKGFSLVELSLVLVIIGVLTALSIKGIAVAQSAKFRAEISKVERLRTGVGSYLLAYGDLEITASSPARVNLNDLLANAFLNPNDVNSVIYAGEQWMVTPCKIVSTGHLEYVTMSSYSATSPTRLCAMLSKTRLELLCYIEVMMDDKDIIKGNGRATEGTNVPATLFTNGCANAPVGTVLTNRYLYLIN